MATNAILRTFRDPAGSLFFEGDRVFRAVSATQAAATLGFLNSNKAREWVRRGMLIASSVVSSDADEVLLEHPRVWFPSYPWEWSPSAWVAAAELTLSLCEDLIGLGGAGSQAFSPADRRARSDDHARCTARCGF